MVTSEFNIASIDDDLINSYQIRKSNRTISQVSYKESQIDEEIKQTNGKRPWKRIDEDDKDYEESQSTLEYC